MPSPEKAPITTVAVGQAVVSGRVVFPRKGIGRQFIAGLSCRHANEWRVKSNNPDTGRLNLQPAGIGQGEMVYGEN